jgi:accessory Sec system protein Asp3
MDSKKDIYVIHWGDLNMDTYLYGSSLTLKDYKIIFENPMMPPEVAIKKWHMMTSYQRDRNEPLLPVLEKGKTYYIRPYITSYPKNRCYLRLNFYNQKNKQISFFTTNKDVDQFVFPDDCYYYDMQLLRGNAEKIIFERVDIYLEEYESSLEESNHYTVLCLEPQGSVIKYPPQEIIDKWDHPIILPGRENSVLFEKIIDKNTYENLTFVGYGQVSNRIANKLHKIYPHSDVMVHDRREGQFIERFMDRRYILEKMK